MFFLKFLIVFLGLCGSILHAKGLEIGVHAESCILINGETGKILYSKNASKEQYPASLVKIATCIWALEHSQGQLDSIVRASPEALRTLTPQEKQKNNYNKYPSYWLETDMSHVGIKVGEEMSFRDLLYGLMLPSGGDAANVIAEHIGGGSIPAFMNDVNGFLRSIGCTKTHLSNPSGLHHPDQVTSAEDLARLSSYAMKNELFRTIVKTARYERPATNKQPATVYVQCNRLLKRGKFYYPFACGIKTGWHSKALHNVVAAAEKDGRLLICVLMHTPEREDMFLDARRLFEKAFTEKKAEKNILAQGVQSFSKTFSNASRALEVYAKERLTATYYPSEEPKFRLLLEWDKIELPIEKGQKVARVTLLADEKEVFVLPLYAVERVEKSYLALLAHFFGNVWVLGALLTLLLVIILRKKMMFKGR